MNHALYYPTIEFRDIGTLKKSLLVWDRVFRIVPRDYAPDDPAEIREAVAEGAVVDLTLKDSERKAAADEFLDLYSRINTPGSPFVWPAGFSLTDFSLLNEDKIDAKLLPLFRELAQGFTQAGFLKVADELVGSYMFYLAKAVAQNRSLELLTDSSDTWIVGSYFAYDGNFDDYVNRPDADVFLCNLAIDDLLPDRLESVPMDELLRSVEKFRVERLALQKEIEVLREAISTCENKQHAEYIVTDFIKNLEKAKEEYRRAIGPFAKRELYSIFSVGIPVTLSFLSLPMTSGSDPYDGLRIGVGVFLGAVSALVTRGLSVSQKTVASYLVTVESLADKRHLRLHRRFEEFMND